MFKYIFILLECLALYYGVNLAFDIGKYARLTGTTEARESSISVENDNENYYLVAHYKVGDKAFSSRYTPAFRNEWAANEEGGRWLRNPRVYVDAKDLSYTALQKVFPLKQLIYTLILFGLGGYFFMLHQRTAK